ncbi:hypothetical protein [Eisenbergiella sp.]
MVFTKKDAPILIVFGQSNAHGHGTRLPEKEKISTPLTNVFGLQRRYNQAYGLKDVVWSGFTTGGMNLGECQDHTYCLAEGFARIWQKKTEEGCGLPPLYIIQISIGSMGIAEGERDGLNMWWPERPLQLHPGALGEVDISLYPLAVQILSLAVKNLKNAGKDPKILGLHWNQWETEVDTGGESIRNARRNYGELFHGLRRAAGIPCPIWLYRPLSDIYKRPAELAELTEIFEEFVKSGEDYHMMDLTQSGLWDPSRTDKGIFQADCVHYTAEVHRYFARRQAEEFL